MGGEEDVAIHSGQWNGKGQVTEMGGCKMCLGTD